MTEKGKIDSAIVEWARSIPLDQVSSVLAFLATRLLEEGYVARHGDLHDSEADDLQLLDAGDVAKIVGLTKGVVYEMARRGKIGSVDVGCVGSRAVRFTRQQVADFIKSREK